VKNIARFDGTSWHAIGNGHAPDNTVWETGVGIDAEGGKVIYAGGLFLQAGSTAAKYIAAWDVDAGTWKTVGTGVNGEVRTVATNGTDLYVGGVFTTAGIYNAYNVAHWDGTEWTPLGSGTNAKVEVLRLCPNGAGGHDLYAGGNFTMAGGIAANRIAKWDGASWSALGSGCNAWVESIAFADNGAGGTDVYVGGQFTTAGGLPASGIAKWDGAAWSAVGGGLTAAGIGVPGHRRGTLRRQRWRRRAFPVRGRDCSPRPADSPSPSSPGGTGRPGTPWARVWNGRPSGWTCGTAFSM
jgi:hypothetical protein